jgi:vacuolar-type H+-ATPase subunit E/Vma4
MTELTEREELIQEIAELEARRAALMAREHHLDAAFIAAASESEEQDIDHELEDVIGELDELSDKIGCANARLYLIEAEISRHEKIRDAAYHD